MPLAKRARKEPPQDSLDCSEAELDCGLLESSSSAESLRSQESQLDPELEADMEQYRKPDASYIELIAKAILESPGQKLRLQDVYNTLEKKYPYFQVADPGWRNSIRHNLSLHECFCKTERCGSGKGHYWSVHPIHLQDFQAGDFRRRTVKSRARQLHQQQQKFQKEGGVGALGSSITPTLSPSTILSPLGGQTHFHFPTPFGSPPSVQSPIPISPVLPSSPSLMYSPTTGGIFYTAFPFPFKCGTGSYSFSSTLPGPAPLLPSSNYISSTKPQLQTSFPTMNGSLPAISGPPQLQSSLPSMTGSLQAPSQLQPGLPPMSESLPETSGLPQLQASLPPMTGSLPVTSSPPQLQASLPPMNGSLQAPSYPPRLQSSLSSVNESLPAPSISGPPVLPPVCCINCPPTSLAASSSSFGTSSTLTTGIRSHIPHYVHTSNTLPETLKLSPFSIDSILASQ